MSCDRGRKMGYRSFRLKLVVLGDKSVGKGVLIRRYLGRAFVRQYKQTIGYDFYIKHLIYRHEQVGNLLVTLTIFDLCSDPAFDNIRPMYYRGSYCAVIVFDATKPETFKNVSKWVKEFWENVKRRLPIVLVGNRIDLLEETELCKLRECAKRFAEELSKMIGVAVPYIEVPSNYENVEEVFLHALKVVLDYVLLSFKK